MPATPALVAVGTDITESGATTGTNNVIDFTSSLAPTVPSSAQVGDLLVAVLGVQAGQSNNQYPTAVTVGSPTVPSGWQVAQSYLGQSSGNVAAAAQFLVLAWKIATSADVGAAVDLGFTVQESATAGYTLSWSAVAAVAAYSGVAGFDVAAAGVAGSGPSIVAPTLSASAGNDLVVELFGASLGASGSISLPATADSPSGGWASGSVGSNGTMLLGLAHQVQASAGTSTAETCSVTESSYFLESAFTVAFLAVQPPSAPTITAPANASYMDMSGEVTEAWAYNPTTGDGSQSDVALEQKSSGASAWSYWNPGTAAWQSTVDWFPYTTGSYTFPAGAFSNGNVYNLSVATEEATYGLQSVFATPVSVTAQAVPTVTVSGPTGIVATSAPTITLAMAPAAGAQITAYRVVVYSAAQVSAPGFTPGGTPNLYDSGTISTSANPTSVGVEVPSGDIPNNTTVTAYAQVTETGGELSGWASGSFTVSLDAPATPTVSAVATTDPTTGLPEIAVTVEGHDNLLSANDASFEGGVGTWTAGPNTTIEQSSAEAADGSYSLLLTATAAGTISALSGMYQL